jgi:hypothetical protein
MKCQNHPDLEATHTAEMPCATRPYREHVPLCTPCADRITAIGGFPVSSLEAQS